MSKSIAVAMFVSALMVAGDVAAQGMLLDFAADKVIPKYQTATCAAAAGSRRTSRQRTRRRRP